MCGHRVVFWFFPPYLLTFTFVCIKGCKQGIEGKEMGLYPKIVRWFLYILTSNPFSWFLFFSAIDLILEAPESKGKVTLFGQHRFA